MKLSIKKGLQGLLFVPMIALGASAVMPVLQPSDVSAQNIEDGVRGGVGDAKTETTDRSVPNIIKDIINLLLYIIGAVAVIMIIFGGFKYVTSGGDSSGVSSAKNTILYAIIGLVVAVLAWAIVNFVLVNLLDIPEN